MTTTPGLDLARGLARALVILAPALALQLATTRAAWWTPGLIVAFLAGGATFAAALVAAAWIEGWQLRRRNAAQLSRSLPAIALLGTLTPIAIALEGIYAFVAIEKGTEPALVAVGGALEAMREAPLTLWLALGACGFAAALLSYPRLRRTRLPTLQTLKLGALWGLPLLLAPTQYLAALACLGVLSLLYSLGDALALHVVGPRDDARDLGDIPERKAQGELSTRDIKLAATLGDPRARNYLNLKGVPSAPPAQTFVELVARLEAARTGLQAMACVLLAELALPFCAEPDTARAQLVAAKIRVQGGKVEVERIPFRRDAPPAEVVLRAALEAAAAGADLKATTSAHRSLQESSQAIQSLLSPELLYTSLRQGLLLSLGFDAEV